MGEIDLITKATRRYISQNVHKLFDDIFNTQPFWVEEEEPEPFDEFVFEERRKQGLSAPAEKSRFRGPHQFIPEYQTVNITIHKEEIEVRNPLEPPVDITKET